MPDENKASTEVPDSPEPLNENKIEQEEAGSHSEEAGSSPSWIKKIKSFLSMAKKRVVGIVAGFLLVLLLVFIIQNLNTIHVRFFWMEGRVTLSIALILAFGTGALLTWSIIRFRDKLDF